RRPGRSALRRAEPRRDDRPARSLPPALRLAPRAVGLRLLTANMRHGGADPEAFADLVRACGAEGVAVQELGPAQADALGRVLAHGRLDPRPDAMGMGIALARPARLARIPLGWRDAHAAELDPAVWPGLAAPLEVLNLHMRNPLTPTRRRAR